MKVVIVECGCFGGICVNIGCILIKMLIVSVYVVQFVWCVGEYGVLVGGFVIVDMKVVKVCKDQIFGCLNYGVE